MGNVSPIFQKMTKDHWPTVAEIYEQGIRTGNATFAQSVPTFDDWDKSHLSHCRLIALTEDICVGWAALSPVSGRCVYSGVAEVSVYVAESARGKGIGLSLLSKLKQDSESNGIWTLQSGIFPENISSIAIHKSCGFRLVGTRERLGKMNGLWRDVMLFERRSSNIL